MRPARSTAAADHRPLRRPANLELLAANLQRPRKPPMPDISPDRIRWLLFAVLALGLAVAVVTLLPRRLYPEPPADGKLYQLVAVGLLAVPLALHSLRLAALTIMMFGGVTKALQPFVSRDAEIADLVADTPDATLGGGIAGLAGVVLRRAREACPNSGSPACRLSTIGCTAPLDKSCPDGVTSTWSRSTSPRGGRWHTSGFFSLSRGTISSSKRAAPYRARSNRRAGRYPWPVPHRCRRPWRRQRDRTGAFASNAGRDIPLGQRCHGTCTAPSSKSSRRANRAGRTRRFRGTHHDRGANRPEGAPGSANPP